MARSWSNAYALGISEIDNQHIKLFDMFDKLVDAMSKGSATTIMSGFLSELDAYTKTHFQLEEKYMIQFKFDGYAEHKEAHEYFIKKINEAKKGIASGQLAVSIELMTFLKKWLIKHIQGTDTNYKNFFLTNGVK